MPEDIEVIVGEPVQAIRVKGVNDDEQAGVDIARRALAALIRQIVEKTVVEGPVVVKTLATSPVAQRLLASSWSCVCGQSWGAW